jgi:hypothetical protein
MMRVRYVASTCSAAQHTEDIATRAKNTFIKNDFLDKGPRKKRERRKDQCITRHASLASRVWLCSIIPPSHDHYSWFAANRIGFMVTVLFSSNAGLCSSSSSASCRSLACENWISDGAVKAYNGSNTSTYHPAIRELQIRT